MTRPVRGVAVMHLVIELAGNPNDTPRVIAARREWCAKVENVEWPLLVSCATQETIRGDRIAWCDEVSDRIMLDITSWIHEFTLPIRSRCFLQSTVLFYCPISTKAMARAMFDGSNPVHLPKYHHAPTRILTMCHPRFYPATGRVERTMEARATSPPGGSERRAHLPFPWWGRRCRSAARAHPAGIGDSFGRALTMSSLPVSSWRAWTGRTARSGTNRGRDDQVWRRRRWDR